MAVPLRLIVVLCLLLGLVVIPLVAFTRGTVSRVRLERFAQRQRLTITVDNGNQVIRYLATTRRWRVAGFIGGVAVSQVVAPPESVLHLDFVVVFAGWFLGALVAEVQVAHLEYGSVRTASLQPRRPGRYVRRFAWALVPAAGALALLTAVATAVAQLTGRADPDWPQAGAWLVVALAVAVAVRLIQQAVLRRAQPLAAPDVIEADDAVRSRALHVLSGGGAALVLIVVLNQLGAVRPVSPTAQQGIDSVRVLGIFAVAFLGWLAATSIWPPPGAPRRPANPAVGTT